MKVVKLIAVILLDIAIAGNSALPDNSSPKHESLEMESRKSDNPRTAADGVIKTIQSEDGDIIDCFDIYKQPAFNHPALKNHKIQMEPSYFPTVDITSRKIKRTKSLKKQSKPDNIPVSVTSQIWQKTGSCPNGTVPIRRSTTTKTTSEFDSKNSNSKQNQLNQSVPAYTLYKNHSISILLSEGMAYIGAKGDIAIHFPRVELDNEYTLSHITLENGPRESYELVRSGWAVNPGVYRDRQTRFFTYWTVDGSQKTGCFDSTCPGFVQVSKDIAPGAAIQHPNSSRPSGRLPNAVMTIYIYKDHQTGDLWVNYGENQRVGYWPAKLFSYLNHHAIAVQWGGDVYSHRIDKVHPHTATGMGSGEYSFPDGQTSGEVRKIRVLENSLVLRYPQWTTTYSDEFNCYNNLLIEHDIEDPEFYYGGPGQDPRCP